MQLQLFPCHPIDDLSDVPKYEFVTGAFPLNPHQLFQGTIAQRDFWKTNRTTSMVTSQFGLRKLGVEL